MQGNTSWDGRRYESDNRWDTYQDAPGYPVDDSPGMSWGTDESPDAGWDAWQEPGSPSRDGWPEQATVGGLAARQAWRATPKRAPRDPGAHRRPSLTMLKGRAVIAAVAAGAAVAATQCAFQDSVREHKGAADTQELAAMTKADPKGPPLTGTDAHFPEILDANPVEDPSQFQDILQNGKQYEEDAAAENDKHLRPLWVKFASGVFTSGFGTRWGAQHLGVDVAAPIGTPIYAVADGTVISAGAASGFGMWVRLQHDDGTITVYGHVDTATVSVGQRVMAGDQIATVGNRGFSTGPHCHFEVWLPGGTKIDPLPWLASRGINLGPEED
ncbi:M23 family metallopeptidase [Nocardia sp. NPDC020380]|uniref:M23 family metallopeptidase n=1 Tax=Nocardia sp. NPDC020380 TaxID=3364309 RepID=UPI0037B206C0